MPSRKLSLSKARGALSNTETDADTDAEVVDLTGATIGTKTEVPQTTQPRQTRILKKRAIWGLFSTKHVTIDLCDDEETVTNNTVTTIKQQVHVEVSVPTPAANAAEPVSEQRKWPSAYLGYFRSALQSVVGPPKTLHDHLFFPQELQWVSEFRQLSDHAAGLYVRLFLRTGPWFRTTERGLIRYQEVDQSWTTLERAVDELIKAGFVHVLSHSSSNKQCASALLSSACHTFVSEQVYQTLRQKKHTKVKSPKKSDGRPRRSRKLAMVTELLHTIRSQKDVFGRTRSLAPALLKALAVLDARDARVAVKEESPHPALVNGKDRNSYRTRLICLDSDKCRLLRRVEFLASIGAATTASVVAPNTGSSILVGVPQQARGALMQTFGKMRFAEYKCAPVETCRPLFHSREEFCRYEEACLGAQRFEKGLEDKRLSSDPTSLTGFSESLPINFAAQSEEVAKTDAVSSGDYYLWPDTLDEISACAAFYLRQWRSLDLKREVGKPRFLLKFEAGSILALLVWLGVDVVQKQKRYEEAIQMIKLLLSVPYAPQRRGRYWTRLLIDMDHIRLATKKKLLAAENERKVRLDAQARANIASWDSDDESMTTPPRHKRSKRNMSSPSGGGLSLELDARLVEQDFQIAAAVVDSLNDCVLPKGGASAGESSDVSHIGTLDGIVISAPDRAALVQRAVTVRDRLFKQYASTDVATGTLSSEEAAQFEATSKVTHDSRGMSLLFLDYKVRAAIKLVEEAALLVKWTPPSFTIEGTPLNCLPGQKSRFVGYDGSTNVSVEALVLQHFARLPLGCEPGEKANSQPLATRQVSTGWQGVHCEGSVIRGIFALLMWDVIFLSGPDTDVPPRAFLTHFQSAPLDFDTSTDRPGGFYLRRKAVADARLSSIASLTRQQIGEAIAESWQQHNNCLCPGLHWPDDRTQGDYFTRGTNSDSSVLFGAAEMGEETHAYQPWRQSPALLQLIAAGLGGPRLSAILKRMCIDYHACRSGFPDLLLWKVTARPADGGAEPSQATCDFVSKCSLNELAWGSTQQSSLEEMPDEYAPLPFLQGIPEPSDVDIRIRFSEVKGPRDHLSQQQIEWLRYFTDKSQCAGGVEAEVVHVVETK